VVREVFRVDRIVQVSGNKVLLFVELFTVNSLFVSRGKRKYWHTKAPSEAQSKVTLGFQSFPYYTHT
jgi:hypothetical protein